MNSCLCARFFAETTLLLMVCQKNRERQFVLYENLSSFAGSPGQRVQIGFDFTFFQVVAGLLGSFTPSAEWSDTRESMNVQDEQSV